MNINNPKPKKREFLFQINRLVKTQKPIKQIVTKNFYFY